MINVHIMLIFDDKISRSKKSLRKEELGLAQRLCFLRTDGPLESDHARAQHSSLLRNPMPFENNNESHARDAFLAHRCKLS